MGVRPLVRRARATFCQIPAGNEEIENHSIKRYSVQEGSLQGHESLNIKQESPASNNGYADGELVNSCQAFDSTTRDKYLQTVAGTFLDLINRLRIGSKSAQTTICCEICYC